MGEGERPIDVLWVTLGFGGLATVVVPLALYVRAVLPLLAAIMPVPAAVCLLLAYGVWTGAEAAYEWGIEGSGFWGAVMDTYDIRA